MKYLVFLITLSQLTFAADNRYTGVIHFIKGKAAISSNGGDFGLAEKGDLLSGGDEIKTGKNSLIIIRFPDKSAMRVEPSSHIAFSSIVERISGKSVGSTNIFLKLGRSVINVVNKSKTQVFKIKTRSSSIGVRGTKFFAGINEATGHLDVAVNSGEVEVKSLTNNEEADAIEAGHGVTIEKGGTFTQPKNYDWVSKVNYDANDKSISPNYFNTFLTAKNLEFRQKRSIWKRNKQKWLKKKALWTSRESAHKEVTSRLKSKRKKFIENKFKFLKKKKLYDLKRNSLFKSQNISQKKFKRLSSDHKKLKIDIANYKKGKKDPRVAADLLERKKKLSLRKKNLKSALSSQKTKRRLYKKEKKSLLSNFGKYDDIENTAQDEIIRKKYKEKKKVKKVLERKTKSKVKKKLKGFFGL